MKLNGNCKITEPFLYYNKESQTSMNHWDLFFNKVIFLVDFFMVAGIGYEEEMFKQIYFSADKLKQVEYFNSARDREKYCNDMVGTHFHSICTIKNSKAVTCIEKYWHDNIKKT